MLVLTRRVGESLVIGKDGRITATILRVQGNQVRIGIDAPNDVPIFREEIFSQDDDTNAEQNDHHKKLTNLRQQDN